LKTMYSYRQQGKFRLYVFVLMPEHVHLLLTPANNVTLEWSVQLIKSGYSHAFGLASGGGNVWRRGFTDYRIRDTEDFSTHRHYIHQNPVKRGLAECPMEYQYSSAYPGFKLDKQTSAAEADAAWQIGGTTEVRALPDPAQ
jgi:putative transposase